MFSSTFNPDRCHRIRVSTAKLCRLGGIPHNRHSFAVSTLLDWHRAGVEADRELPLLTTYLGHQDPAHTYWYLQATPELLALVAQRLDGIFGARP
jgi:hypothetical protein